MLICRPGSMKVPYLTLRASRSTMTLCLKSSVSRSSQAPASTRVSQHQDAGHHRKGRKVVGQVLFAQGQVLDRVQALTRLHFNDPIDQVETHDPVSDA